MSDEIHVPQWVRDEVENADILVLDFRNPEFLMSSSLQLEYGRSGRRETMNMDRGDPISMKRSVSGVIIIGDGDVCLAVKTAKDRRLLLRSVRPLAGNLIEDESGSYLSPVGGLDDAYSDEDIIYRMETIDTMTRKTLLPVTGIETITQR